MFISDIDVEAAVASCDCPIRRELVLLAAGLDTRFLRAGTMLATAVEMIDRVIGGLDGIAAALDERTAAAAVADMRYVASRLAQLPTRQASRGQYMDAVAGIARTLNDQVMEMHEMLRVLSIYGMNIKIAASGEDQFVGFVEGMTGKLSIGERQLDGFMVQLKELMKVVASAQQADRLLVAESGKVLPEVPERLAGDAVALAAHLAGVAALARKVATIARSVRGKVAVVLGALQVGDSTRQRLEHIVSALQLIETHSGNGGADPAVVGYVDRLLVAQLDATMRDFVRETMAMLTSLADLGPDTSSLLDLIAEQSDGGGRTFLSRLDQGITNIERVTMRLREAEGHSRTMVKIIADTVAELSRQLTSVQRTRLDVHDIATNTRLLCQRHGATGKAVSVIATEVDAYAAKLGRTTAHVAEAIARLGEVEMLLRQESSDDEGRDMGEMLSEALAVIRLACQRTEQATMEGRDNARQVVELLAPTGQYLAQELAVKDVMDAASRTLASRTPPATMTEAAESTLQTLLPEIARFYTMASEREVHASFLFPGIEAVVVSSETDDDDGLF